MLCVDVNVLVHAVNTQDAHHAQAGAWLQETLRGPEWVLLPDSVVTGFARIVTNSRILPSPLHPDRAFALVDWILGQPRAAALGADDSTREIFRTLVSSLGLRGNDIPDAWLAASAMSVGATFVTYDRGFRRFPDLKTLTPTG